jgi:hypothetical protein
VPAWSAAGRALGQAFPPNTTLAAVPIGALGYYSNLPVIDMAGLTDRNIARAPVADLGAGWAGHEKHDGPYVVLRRPEIILLGNVYVDTRPELPPGRFPPRPPVKAGRTYEGSTLFELVMNLTRWYCALKYLVRNTLRTHRASVE